MIIHPPVKQVLKVLRAELTVQIILRPLIYGLDWNTGGDRSPGGSGHVGSVANVLGGVSDPLTDVISRFAGPLTGSIHSVANVLGNIPDKLANLINCVANVRGNVTDKLTSLIYSVAQILPRSWSMPNGDSKEALICSVPPVIDSVSGSVHGIADRRHDALVEPTSGIICGIDNRLYDAFVDHPTCVIRGVSQRRYDVIICKLSKPVAKRLLGRINPLPCSKIVIRSRLRGSRLRAVDERICRLSGIVNEIAGRVDGVRCGPSDIIRGVSNPLPNIIRRIANPLTGSIKRVADILSDARLAALDITCYAGIVRIRNLLVSITSVPPFVYSTSSIVHGVRDSLTDIIGCIANKLASGIKRVTDILSGTGFVSLPPVTVVVHFNVAPVPPLIQSASGIVRRVTDKPPNVIRGVSNPLPNIIRRIANPLTGGIHSVADPLARVATENRFDILLIGKPERISKQSRNATFLITNQVISHTGGIHSNQVAVLTGQSSIPEIVSSLSNKLSNVICSISDPLTGGTKRVGNILACAANLISVTILSGSVNAVPPAIEFTGPGTDPFADVSESRGSPVTCFAESIANPLGRIIGSAADSIPRANGSIPDSLSSRGKPSTDAVPQALLLRGFLLSGLRRLSARRSLFLSRRLGCSITGIQSIARRIIEPLISGIHRIVLVVSLLLSTVCGVPEHPIVRFSRSILLPIILRIRKATITHCVI